MRPFLGTFVEVGAYSATGNIAPAIDAAFKAIEEIQARLSFHSPHSDLSLLNSAQGKPVILRPGSARVLRLAKAMTRLSGGRFNCTVGGALVRRGVLPDHGFREFLDIGQADDILLQGSTARLRRPVLITLDGIAKGYAVDMAIRALRNAKMQAGWVNAGGDLRVFGEHVLPVQRRELDGSMTSLGGLKKAALASSGVRVSPDETFPGWIVGEKRSPQLGVWTVLARTAWRADALTKVASMSSDSERSEWIRRLGGKLVEGISS